MQEQEDGISLLRRALVAAWSEPQDDEVVCHAKLKDAHTLVEDSYHIALLIIR